MGCCQSTEDGGESTSKPCEVWAPKVSAGATGTPHGWDAPTRAILVWSNHEGPFPGRISSSPSNVGALQSGESQVLKNYHVLGLSPSGTENRLTDSSQ